MSLPISPVNPAAIQSIDPGAVLGAGTASPPGVFQSMLTNAVSSAESYRQESDQATANFLSGGNEELHQVALAAQQSELAFEMFVQVRNKVISAYQEIMRMSL